MKPTPPPTEKRIKRKLRGFTLVEVLVVILIIVILIGIGLAIGAQVQANAQTSVLKEELNNLQAALVWYQQNSGGQTPSSSVSTIPPMLIFLENYQRMNAYQDTSPQASWHEKTDILSLLPANLVVSGQFPGPIAGSTMTGIIEVLDPWGNPIQFMPSSGTLYYFPTSASTAGFTGDADNFFISQSAPAPTFPSYITYNGGGTNNTPPAPPISGSTSPTSSSTTSLIVTISSTPPHAPYFYSFGSKGPLATNIAYGNYVYSYGP